MAAFEAFMIPNSPKVKAGAQTKLAEVLVLAPFTAIPKIIFQDVKLGQTVKQALMVQNPTNNDIQVELVPKVSLVDHNLGFSSTNFEVAATEGFNLEIAWTPSKAGTLKVPIGVRTNTKFRTDFVIIGAAVEPIKNPKKILGAQNSVKTSARAKPVAPAPREPKQPAVERRKTFVLRGNKENVANAKQRRPAAPAGAAAAAAAAAVAPAQRAPEPAPRRLPSAATVAHPSRFENLAISPFVSGHKRFQNFEMSPAVNGPWNERTSPVAIPETIRRETYGVPAQGTFLKKLVDCKEEPDCSIREPESFVTVFSPQFCSTVQKKRSDLGESGTATESSFEEGNERLSAGTYVLDRLSTETYIKEEPEERLSPVGDERATKGCVRNLSGTVLEAISEEDGNRGAPPAPPPPTFLAISPPKPFNPDKKPARMSPTVVTRRKITVRPEVKVFTPPDKEDAAKMPCPPAVPRVAMPRLTLSRAATTSRQSLSTSSSRRSLSASQPPKVLSAASSRLSLISASSSSRQSLGSSVYSSSSSSRMSRLTSSARARRQEKSEFLYDPDALISEMINNDLVAASTSADPFLANTLFFDDSWKRKQELDMIKWLNALLTPPAELAASTDSPPVDLATVWQRCCRSELVELAPTREDVSAEVYDAAGRLFSLRRAAVSFLAQTAIRQVLGKVAVHIDKKLLVVREDKDLHLDTGLKYQVMELLLCYNPLWLRIGLEAIYGRTVSLASNCDVVGLAKFIVENLLTDRNIVAEHSHPTVPHLRQPSFADAMKKFILKKFFFLVYFLDRAKSSKLIKHDPCLFMKNAKYKESREIVIAFSSAFLSGVGDVMKHLALLGYHVSVKQQYIDEFEFAVTCLKDLRDGVRLVRVMEIILNKDGLMAKLRVPAISMLQKVHNMEVALNALSEAGYLITGNITAKDLVNGHYEKTLSLLWQIIYKFQAPRLEEAAQKIQAWWSNRRLYVTIKNRVAARKRAVYAAAATRIQAAWRARMARKRLVKLREQRAAEEARRESAAVVVQKTWRMFAARQQLLRAIRASNRIKEWFTGAIITRHLRHKFLVKRQAAIKIQSAVRGYLTRKRLANLRRTAAALRIQTWLRRRKTAKALEGAAVLAGAWAEERKRVSKACRVIQARFRARREMERQRNHYVALRTATITIQRRFRLHLLKKRDRMAFLSLKRSVISCQQVFRAQRAMKEDRARYVVLKEATVTIQRWFRAQLAVRQAKEEFLRKRSAAVSLQRRFRLLSLMKRDRMAFLSLKRSAISCQQIFRAQRAMKEERARYIVLKEATVTIQTRFRAQLAMRQAREEFLLKRSAAVVLQVRWRALTAMKDEKTRYEKLKRAAVCVQRRWRAIQTGREARREYEAKRTAAVVLQRRWRAKVQMDCDRAAFLKLRSAITVLQTCWRYALKRRANQRVKEATISARMHQAATKIQAVWRGWSVRKKQSAACAEILERCKAATMEASEEKTLASRSLWAVALLRSGNLHKAFDALVALNKITCLSRELCVSIAEDGVVTDLYVFLGRLNRSELHRDFLLEGTAILLNMTKCAETTRYVWQEGRRTFFYLHLMNVWLNKEENIFLNCATVLWHFAQCPDYAQTLLVEPKMSCFLEVFMRKASKKRKLLSNKLDQDVLPADRPSWGLALKHDRPFRFPNELFAVENLIASLYKGSRDD